MGGRSAWVACGGCAPGWAGGAPGWLAGQQSSLQRLAEAYGSLRQLKATCGGLPGLAHQDGRAERLGGLRRLTAACGWRQLAEAARKGGRKM